MGTLDFAVNRILVLILQMERRRWKAPGSKKINGYKITEKMNTQKRGSNQTELPHSSKRIKMQYKALGQPDSTKRRMMMHTAPGHSTHTTNQTPCLLLTLGRARESWHMYSWGHRHTCRHCWCMHTPCWCPHRHPRQTRRETADRKSVV